MYIHITQDYFNRKYIESLESKFSRGLAFALKFIDIVASNLFMHTSYD